LAFGVNLEKIQQILAISEIFYYIVSRVLNFISVSSQIGRLNRNEVQGFFFVYPNKQIILASEALVSSPPLLSEPRFTRLKDFQDC